MDSSDYCHLIKTIIGDMPWPAWPVQEKYMIKCLECFSQGQVGFLESGSGTGKTIALLCTSLGWVHHHALKGESRTVVYAAKTMKERDKVIAEFRKTKYSEMTMDVFEHDNADEKASVSFFTSKSNQHRPECFDKKHINIFFTTHKCILEEATRASISTPTSIQRLDLKGCLLLIDDAHFIENRCKSVCSSTMNLSTVEFCIEKLNKEVTNIPGLSSVLRKVEHLRNIFWSLTPHNGSADGQYKSGKDIAVCFSELIFDDFDLENLKKEEGLTELNDIVEFVCHVQYFCLNDSFRLYVTQYDLELPQKAYFNKSAINVSRTLHFVCLDASVVMKKVIDFNPHSIIFTSAILSPIYVMRTELDIIKPVEFLNSHVVQDHQIFSRIVTCGAGGYYLNSSFNEKYDYDYIVSVGKSIMEVSKVVPETHNIVVYFSSNELLQLCRKNWLSHSVKGESLWSLISKWKMVQVLERSVKVNPNKRGSCFLAVLREVLEDLEYQIAVHHVVVFVGHLKLYLLNEPMIQLKSAFNNAIGSKLQSSREFFNRESYKAVKLTTDFLIRKQSEYGVVLFFDYEFYENDLSLWLREQTKVEKRFLQLLYELEDFFKFVETRILASSCGSTSTDGLGSCARSTFSVQGYEIDRLIGEINVLKYNNSMMEREVKKLKNEVDEARKEEALLKEDLRKLEQETKTTKQNKEDSLQAGDAKSGYVEDANNICKSEVTPTKKVTPRKRPLSE